jgi:nitroreductase
MATLTVSEAIRRRRSIGRSEGDVPADVVRELIDLATWAPNHNLTEPWTFTVVRGSVREKLGERWAAVRAAELNLQGEKLNGFLKGETQKLLRAPVLVIVSTRTDDDPVVACEDFAATAAAVQNFLLAAWERGLSAMWRTGELAYHPWTKAFLGLNPSDRIVAVIYLGARAAVQAKESPRKRPPIRWLQADDVDGPSLEFAS